MNTKLRCWLRSVQKEDGSIIVEASLIFPVIFYCVLAILFFALLIYQTVLSSHAAALAAERAAACWDNSYKEAVTGAYDKGQHDGIYWRLLDDRLLDKVIGGGFGGENHMVMLPAVSDGGSLPERKLVRAARLVPEAFRGKMSYENGLPGRRITAVLDKPLYQAMFRNMAGREISNEGQAVSAVVEPAEFIRTVEFARYMATKLKEWKGQGVPTGQAKGILKKAAGQTSGSS
ncbi:TadE family protein [Paenibacillus popilliae]|uniref:DNA-directed RNA polymerase n=1 Tax=Paenibacillus popilliae ATCC 14706 TaxID=1212764 RepID=M9LN97_PAEPP|nr:TadE family protein [Paenibacillus popilliae]GAC41796.1 DNA-directed RNA polymerase [Paenibacillus popilliae ATCC 14706]